MKRTQRLNTSAISLRNLFPRARFVAADDIEVHSCVHDALACKPDDLLVVGLDEVPPDEAALRGMAAGARGVVTEQLLPVPVPQCIVPDSRIAYAKLTAELADNPSREILSVGVMGGDGKTSTVLLLSTILRKVGLRTGYQCDLGCSDGIIQEVPDSVVAHADELTDWFCESRDAQCQVAVVELSEQLLKTKQLEATEFDIIVVCGDGKSSGNDRVKTLYQEAIAALGKDGVVVACEENADAIEAADQAGRPVLSFGSNEPADVRGQVFESHPGETTSLITAGDTTVALRSNLCGDWMLQNQLAATATCLLLDIPLHKTVEAIGTLQSIPGRMQRVPAFEGPGVVLDASTDCERLRKTCNSLRKESGIGKIWCVAACNHDTSPEDLAALGYMLERCSDRLVLTSDSAGAEFFLPSAHNAMDGISDPARPQLIAGRAVAIAWALENAAPDDTILVVGGWGSDSPRKQRAAINADVAIIERVRRELDAPEDDGPVIYPHPALLKAM